MQVKNARRPGNNPNAYTTILPSSIRYNGVPAKSRGAIRSVGPKRLGLGAEAVISTHKKLQRKRSFLDLPTDIFLKLLDWLGMPDIFNLRRVCKPLKGLTQLHSTWVKLATYHVIGNDLPWPTWALPLSDVPSPTLEYLTLRALTMRTLWDAGDPNTHRKFSRCIQRPRESVTWMRLIHSRWLVIQQNAATLEFWDLEDLKSEEPALSIDSLNGIVDGSVVWSRGKSRGILMISTRSCEAGRIEYVLPYPKAEDEPVSARVVDSFTEFSRLMDGDEHIAAFLHYKGNRGNFIRSMSTGSIIRLDPMPEYSKETQPQQAFGIQIKRNVVAVATAWSVDLYWRDTIITSLQEAEAELSIQPFQRLSYLGGSVSEGPQELTTASAFFLAHNPKFLSLPPDEDSIFLCVGKDTGRHLYVVEPVKDNHASPSTYRLFHEIGLFWSDPYRMLFYESGESGRRSVFIVDEPRGLSLCGISIPADLSQHANGSSNRGRIGWWRITDQSSKDLAHYVIFEEATGACAVAMGSGRVWIADLTTSEIVPRNYTGCIDSPNETATPRADLAWPYTHPLPWPAVVDQRDYPPGPNDPSAGDWSTDVETYYPSKNRLDCFGGATWFVNQALNIPEPATSLFFNVPAKRGELSMGIEILSAGDRLLAVEKVYEFEGYSVVLFDRDVQLEEVVTRLLEGGDILDLPCNELEFDSRPLERYAAWRGRMEPISGRHMW